MKVSQNSCSSVFPFCCHGNKHHSTHVQTKTTSVAIAGRVENKIYLHALGRSEVVWNDNTVASIKLQRPVTDWFSDRRLLKYVLIWPACRHHRVSCQPISCLCCPAYLVSTIRLGCILSLFMDVDQLGSHGPGPGVVYGVVGIAGFNVPLDTFWRLSRSEWILMLTDSSCWPGIVLPLSWALWDSEF